MVRGLTTSIKKRPWGNTAKKRVYTRRLADAMFHATQIIRKGREQWDELCKEHSLSESDICNPLHASTSASVILFILIGTAAALRM